MSLRPTRPARFLARVCVVAAAGVGAYHLVLEWRALTLREPMGIWESYYISLSRHWANLYERGHFTDALGLYGPVYPATVRPLLAAGFEPYLAHRLAAFLALLAACGLVAFYLRTKGVRGHVIAAIVSIIYCLNAGTYSIMARPDFLLVAEAYLLLFLGERMARGGRPQPGESVLLGLLALVGYLTKPYALLAWATAAGYLALGCGIWSPALISGGIIAAGIGLYALTHYYFWLDTFKFLQSQTALEAAAFVAQTRDFAVLSGGLLAAALFARPWAKGRGARPDYWLFATLAGGLPLLYLGFHAGAYLTYYLHLLLPPLSILAALRIQEAVEGGRRWWLPVFLAANLAVLAYWAPPLPTADPGWDSMASDMARQKGLVVGSWITEPLTRTRGNLELTGDGITPLAVTFPFRLPGADPVLVAARQEANTELCRLTQPLIGPGHPAAIYLEGIVLRMSPAQYVAVKQQQPELLMIPFDQPDLPDRVFVARENLGAIRRALLSAYQPQAYFDVRPYYIGTNYARQTAGSRHAAILKLVPKS